MVKHFNNRSIRQLCLEEILKHDRISILQIISAVGKHIPATRAIQAGRAYINRPCYKKILTGDMSKYTQTRLIQLGQREIISGCIQSLFDSGKIRRVSRGIYAPIPKIHIPNV